MWKSCQGAPFQTKFGQCIIECAGVGRTVADTFGVNRILKIRPIGCRTPSYHFKDTGELEAAFLEHGTLSTAQADAVLIAREKNDLNNLGKLTMKLYKEEQQRKREAPTVIKLSAKPKKPLTDEELIQHFGEPGKLQLKRRKRKEPRKPPRKSPTKEKLQMRFEKHRNRLDSD
ncbi:Oidioi.mRNA.OKI2018_I69.XSR.g13915.t1.cds [Oikopleura dioica]|uniref:Oidioi.mRNA.OKI2018_I69.XSR.g13915.t1.cds n=1 Tax=Oikopleura dioica TaxID=34765 RepID=A0ABN7SC28_OIKDI|nr:Oidioi.mRNA.OKI2018_I69.XSR.g13915.t1.cds [Oikopleura dioica]